MGWISEVSKWSSITVSLHFLTFNSSSNFPTRSLTFEIMMMDCTDCPDFPQTVQSYIHRIGRTARAGLPGKAITFFSNEDAPHLRTIANVLKASGCDVPQYMLDMKKPSKNLKRFRAKIPVKRKEVGGGGRDLGKEKGKRKRDMIEGSKRRAGGKTTQPKKVKGDA